MANEELKEEILLDDQHDTYQWQSSTQYNDNASISTKDQQWLNDFYEDKLKILDPDDPLMKRFQDALKSHLLRMDNKLSNEIKELEAAIKDNDKIRENEGIILYNIQQETAQQYTAIENYKHMLAEVINLRGDSEENLKEAQEINKNVNKELEAKKFNEKNLLQNIESLDIFQEQFSKWENEMSGNITISQRISEKDAAVERDLIYQKQQKDYVLYKLEEEIDRLQTEIRDFTEQLELKDQEKINLSQTIADANANLEGLEKEHKTLYSAWNNVLNLISQRDKINEEILSEQRKIRESLQNLDAQVEKLKKDSMKEMENNEYLTSLQSKMSDTMKTIKKSYDSDKEKYLNLESNLIKISKLMQQTEKEYNCISSEYKSTINQEKLLNKEIIKADNLKRVLENDVLDKLNDKACHDNTIQHLNKVLHDTKDSNIESALNLTRLENSYSKNLFELEKLNSVMENEKFDLNAAIERNLEKEKEIKKLQIEAKNYNLLFDQKERKVIALNKKIEEMLSISGRDEESPLNLKLVSVNKSIDEIEGKIKKAEQFWLRQQGYIFSLSEERDIQMRELSIATKDIILMEKKNIKIEEELEKQQKEEANINRSISALQYKLLQINLRLASQKELKNEMEDKNAANKIEYINSLQDAEMELIRLQTDIKELNSEKCTLKEDLRSTQQESLSWEKKVILINEINKSCKEKRSTGGDIAMMKSEIHKMEIRFSYLQKIQETLIQDMEFCISRRENIMDEVMAKEKRNPKNLHNQRIVLRKRIEDQRNKIKQMTKEIKQIENKIKNFECEQQKLLEYLNEGQKLLRQNEDIIPDLDKQIMEAEMIKHHNLEVLVRKQHKVNMLRDMKNGKYKLLIKNEITLNEEWEKQKQINKNLKDIMQQTEPDFPLLQNEVRKILLTLEAL